MSEKLRFLFLARGSSHIRYFKRFAQANLLHIDIVKIGRIFHTPLLYSHWKQTACVDMDSILDIYMQKLRITFPNLAQTFFWQGVRWFLHYRLRFNLAYYNYLIRRYNPDVVGVWNGQKLPGALVAQAAKHNEKQVVYFENGLLPNSMTCDWKGVNAVNSLPRSPTFYRQFNEDVSLSKQLVARKGNEAKKAGITQDGLPKNYIFVPFQVETDSQIVSNSPWIKSMSQLYTTLVEVVENLQDEAVYFVVKEHPSENKRFDALHKKHSKIIFANHIPTQYLIEHAAFVMTINSTVGIEALLLEQKVICLGDACYDIEGLTVSARNPADLMYVLQNRHKLHFDTNLRKQFLSCLSEHYVMPYANSGTQTEQAEHNRRLCERLTKQDKFTQFISQYK